MGVPSSARRGEIKQEMDQHKVRVPDQSGLPRREGGRTVDIWQFLIDRFNSRNYINKKRRKGSLILISSIDLVPLITRYSNVMNVIGIFETL